jgi:SAM-dependent methyltransferase
MNLFDLVRRKDRWLEGAAAVEACEWRTKVDTQRAVRFTKDGELRVRDAHAASCLADLPDDLGWQVVGPRTSTVTVELQSGARRDVLATAGGGGGEGMPLPLRWPVPSPRRFDLVVRVATAGPLHLCVGPRATPRKEILPLLRGSGVEVGPGLAPSVRPQPGVEVRYVEKKHPAEWAATYAKRELTADERALWDHYVVDSARYLRAFPAGSLDFVFSHHVLEHLVDPIGTLARWWTRLAPGGVLAGVVPDQRFTFDWRQPPGTIEELRAQLGVESDEPSPAMYERWCRHTAPDTTPASLRARDYSIHVSYLTPAVMRQLLEDVAARVAQAGEREPDELWLGTVPNGKDFGFVLRKPRG